MKKGYTSIAYSIGRGINQRLKSVGADPLPDGLLNLLHGLREKDDLEECLFASETKKPPRAA